MFAKTYLNQVIQWYNMCIELQSRPTFEVAEQERRLEMQMCQVHGARAQTPEKYEY